MKSIQKFIVLSLMVLFATSTLIAQGGPTKKGSNFDPATVAQKKTDKMAEEFNLSEEQKAEVAKINLAYVEKMKAAKASSADKSETRTQMKALRNEHMSAVKSVLTTDQVAQMDAMKAERGDRKGKGHKGKKGRKGGDKSPQERAQHLTEKMVKQLELSPDQAKRVESIHLKYAEKREAMKGTAKDDREAVKAQWKSLKAKQKEEIKSVLTTDQITKLEAMKKRKGKKGKKDGDERKRI